MIKKERIIWIDGLKYFACIGVYISHFFGTFIFDKAFTEFGSSFIIKNFSEFFSILTNGNFWVCVFCILSGMFSIGKSINSLNTLIKEIFLRYIRFVIPFIFMCVFIKIIDVTFGFKTQEFGELFANDWLMMFYPEKISFISLIKCIFLFNNSCNYVLWTIAPIFIGNVIIYFSQYIFNKIKIKNSFKDIIIFLTIGIFTIICIAAKSTLIYSCACCIGAIIPKIAKITKKMPIGLCCAAFFILITIFHFHNEIINLCIPKITLMDRIGLDLFYLNTVWHILYAVFLIILLFRLTFIQKFFSLRFFRKFSYTSFSVYIFHCPIIFSLSLILFGITIKRLSYTLTFFVILIFTSALIFLWSIAYEKTIGKLCAKIIKKAKELIKE